MIIHEGNVMDGGTIVEGVTITLYTTFYTMTKEGQPYLYKNNVETNGDTTNGRTKRTNGIGTNIQWTNYNK